MNKIGVIIRREYLMKVKKKSFIVMTVLTPLLIAALWIVPFFLSTQSEKQNSVVVVDEAEGLYFNKFKDNKDVRFSYISDIEKAQKAVKEGAYDAVLEIVKSNDNLPIKSFLFYSDNEPSLSAQENIRTQLTDILKDHILICDYQMSKEDLAFFNNPQIGFYSKDIRSGEDSYKEIKTALGAVSGFLIYMFIFFFGAQVMRSVSEEKTNRIVEVLVSTVKPIQLLMGKIVGIALVGLTQFALWVILSVCLIGGLQSAYPKTFSAPKQENITVNERVISVNNINTVKDNGAQISQAVQGLFSINYTTIILMLLFYFISGYFLYAALFGAVGALIDTDTDNGQFTLPITLPLILAMLCFPIILNYPSSGVAFWLSIIPLTSPMVMMMRIPFGVPFLDIALSVACMIAFIAFCIWMAAKIYRTGILMYGKNITYKEIFKWFKYKN